MKIVIINPNSSKEMTQSIARVAEKFVNGRYQVEALATEGAPEFIDYPEDTIAAAPGMIQIVKEYEHTSDAFIVACHCDPNVQVLRQITDKPVIGIGEASMRLAAMLGARFSVIATDQHSVTHKLDLIHEYGLDHYCASVRVKGNASNEEQAYVEASKKALEKDLAEVIVLGCAGLCELSDNLTRRLNVPVLDGIVCGLMIAEGMVNAGYKTSKIRLYAKR